MESCGICYNDFKDYQLVHPGCCNSAFCKDCIINEEKCPICRNEFFWGSSKKAIYGLKKNLAMYKDKAGYYENMYHARLTELTEAKLDKDKINHKYEVMKKQNDNLIQEYYKLNNIIMAMRDEEYNAKHLKKVILKYHLNLV